MHQVPIQVFGTKFTISTQLWLAPHMRFDDSCYALQSKAEMRALAKKMLRGRARTDVLESAYHRYVFHDKDARPIWFAQDEERHLK